MLKPVPMRKVTVIVTKAQLTNFLTFAGQQGLLHLITVPDKQAPPGTSPFEAGHIVGRTAAVRNRLSSMSSVLSNGSRDFTPTPDLQKRVRTDSVDNLSEYLDKESAALEQQVKLFDSRQDEIQTEKDHYLQLSRLLSGLENMGVRLDSIGDEAFTTVLMGEAPREAVNNARAELDTLTYGNAIFAVTSSGEKSETFFAILPTAFQDDAKQALSSIGARLEPGLADLPSNPTDARRQVEQKLEDIREREKQLTHDRDQFSKDSGPKYASLTFLAELLDIRARALMAALSTEFTVLLQAWIPDTRVAGFTKGAVDAIGDDISIQLDEHAQERMVQRAHEHSEEMIPEHVVEQEPPPTLVDVPAWFKPLQSIVNNFGTPAYHELNPMPFMIFTYPIIYGLMFGDVGQGILFVLGGLFLWTLKRKGRKIFELGQIIEDGAELVVMLGIGIIVFGIIFGDFFGFDPSFLRINNGAPIFSPVDNKVLFMVVTLFVGVIHLTFGLSLSAANKIRNKEYTHALFGPISWIVFYVSSIYLISQVVLAGFKFGVTLKPPTVFFFIPIMASLGLMAAKEGGLHMFEAFLSSASNTLSYLRIWALNIADFELKAAMVIALPGIGGVIAGNSMVLIIEGLIVFVQTLRLHWVEWFSKFYEGTGTRFSPYQEPLTIGLVQQANV